MISGSSGICAMPSKLAAVVFDPETPVDDMMAEALADPALRGRRIVGYLQGYEPGTGCDCTDIVLRALHDGSRRKITQDLGTGSQGCRLDSVALTEVAGEVDAVLAVRPDLLVLNRFGKVEAEGGGFRATLEQALLSDVPVLIAVGRKHLGFWQDYCGDLAETLPCDVPAIRGFIREVCGIDAAVALRA
ncbi:DUF2478 domain-containing protein [Sinirhodobacter populi]|nr:DUF2478 domain-containing protein [Sinirhodobacter populi]